MNPRLRKLILKGFRSLSEAEIELEDLTFLVGRNGSGKSNIGDGVSLLAEVMRSPLVSAIERRNGLESVRQQLPGPPDEVRNGRGLARMRVHRRDVGLGVEFEGLSADVVQARYGFELHAAGTELSVAREQCAVTLSSGERHWFDRSARDLRTNLINVTPSLDASSLLLPLVGGDRRFTPLVRAIAGMRVYSFRPDSLRDLRESDGAAGLHADGSNAAAVLEEVQRNRPGDAQRIARLLATVAPDVASVGVTKYGSRRIVDFVQAGATTRPKV